MDPTPWNAKNLMLHDSETWTDWLLKPFYWGIDRFHRFFEKERPPIPAPVAINRIISAYREFKRAKQASATKMQRLYRYSFAMKQLKLPREVGTYGTKLHEHMKQLGIAENAFMPIQSNAIDALKKERWIQNHQSGAVGNILR